MLTESYPITNAVAVTKHDTNLIAKTRGIYVGVSGDIACLFAGDTVDVLIKAAPVGVLPFRLVAVRSTSTTATNILALY